MRHQKSKIHFNARKKERTKNKKKRRKSRYKIELVEKSIRFVSSFDSIRIHIIETVVFCCCCIWVEKDYDREMREIVKSKIFEKKVKKKRIFADLKYATGFLSFS